MIPLFRPGTSVVHRMQAGAKLAALAALAVGLTAFPHGPGTIAFALIIVCGLYALAGLPTRVLAAEVWRLRWLVLVLGAALWVFVSPLTAWIATGRVIALILLATLLTLTTRMSDLIEVLRRALRPLARLGVDAEAIALAISLAITAVPVVGAFAAQIAEAQRARGVRLGIRAAVPLLVRTLRHADDIGDALAARGLV